MELLPPYYLITVIFIFGLIIGSFLDVVITRFHTGKSINGRSRCLSCGHTLSWYELFPLLSYVALKGRCKDCGGHIPLRLLIMELITAGLFVYAYLVTDSLMAWALGCVLLSLLIVIAVYDIDHMVIPHEFVFAALALAVLIVGIALSPAFDLSVLALHALSGCLAFLFYGGLWLVSKGRWIGLGDAKLAVPLALMFYPLEAFSMIVLSFWIGAGVSVAILLIQKLLQSGKHHLPFVRVPLTMKSEVPFAPFMIAAFVLVYFHRIDVLAVMSGLF